MQNRVQRALARRERMRRSRDQAWIVFAAFACAALVGWYFFFSQATSDVVVSWWATAIYAAIAVVSTFLAVRALGAARRLTRRMDEAEPLQPTDRPEDRPISVWDELWSWRRRK